MKTVKYEGETHNLLEFLDLTSIPIGERCELFFNAMNKELIFLIAADIAESVLHVFEREYPDDLRPRQAIEAARRGYSALAATYATLAANNGGKFGNPQFAAYAAAAAANTANYAYYANTGDVIRVATHVVGNALIADPKAPVIEIMKRYLNDKLAMVLYEQQ